MTNRSDLSNVIRILCMDAVQRARSGHPGMPMGMADVATVLWRKYLQHDPNHPRWPNRDRFVLSNGHGSILLYTLLHLSGYDLKMDMLKQFRQFGSNTPGHPEHGVTVGVETTTGPLGQGLGNAVGMALAERLMATRFNREGFDLFDHYTYAFVGDGCLMEGISHEVCSLAGTLNLSKLIVFYDDNGISIDGKVSSWFTDDTPMRFKSLGWHVIADIDGHDMKAVTHAIDEGRKELDMPTLICCKTVIGRGAPNKQGSAAVHGMPLGEDEVLAVREALGWKHPPFEVPKKVYRDWDAKKKGKQVYDEWTRQLKQYRERYPEQATELIRRLKGQVPENFDRIVKIFVRRCQKDGRDQATRKSLKRCLDVYGEILPELIGGSADLTTSNNTRWSGSRTISEEDMSGNYLHFGAREFGMYAISNGLALYGGFLPYCGTFLVFSDYGRGALRLASLMKQRGIFVLTHDSIGVGEDGPTHQPVEQLASLRLIPNLEVWRPCDLVETAVAFQSAVHRHEGPIALILSRQSVAHKSRENEQLELIRRGGYILYQPEEGEPEAIVMATGSEVDLALTAARVMAERGHCVRVVSLPCLSVFAAQEPEYLEEVLPAAVTARVVVEAGRGDCWWRYAGPDGVVLSIDDFGRSGDADTVSQHFGFTEENLVAIIERMVG